MMIKPLSGSLCGLLLLLFCAPTLATQTSPVDVRLVIDVSGSMRATDPRNLRVPALELMVKLLPEGSRAGIWTFADQVSLLMPLGSVDDAWRQRALAQTGQVDSSGLLTQMGKALEQVVLQDEGAAQVIFLTDGKVDIGPGSRVNAQERNRILESLLPAINTTGSRLHTIALSADADAELMATLSQNTDGLHRQVDTADELMPVFLQILDQSVPTAYLPLEGNRFQVDDSVRELTALVFRQPNSPATRLVSPTGADLIADQPQQGVTWYAADSYDLVTVVEPARGQWQIVAEENAQNRVTVVSDLQLMVEPLPVNLVAGESPNIQFYFLADGQRLLDRPFLQLLDAEIVLTKTDSPARWHLPLEVEPDPVDGSFTQALPALRERGHYQLILRVDGKSFAREYRYSLQVGGLLGVRMYPLSNPLRYRIEVTADQQLVDVARTAVVAQIKTSIGRSYLDTLKMLEPGLWQLDITPQNYARYAVELSVSGEDVQGEAIRERLPTQFFTHSADAELVPLQESEAVDRLRQLHQQERAELAASHRAEQETSAIEEQAASAKKKAAPEPSVTTPDPEPQANANGSKWLWVLLAVLGNIGLGYLIYLGYRKLTNRDVIDELEDIEQQLLEPQAEPVAEAAPAEEAAEEDPMQTLDTLVDTVEPDAALFPLEDAMPAVDPPMDDLDEEEEPPVEPDSDPQEPR